MERKFINPVKIYHEIYVHAEHTPNVNDVVVTQGRDETWSQITQLQKCPC